GDEREGHRRAEQAHHEHVAPEGTAAGQAPPSEPEGHEQGDRSDQEARRHQLRRRQLRHRQLDEQIRSAPDQPQEQQATERCGIHAITITDHPLVPLAWEANGGHHDWDPFTTLAYMAARTERIRLMTNIIVLPYRSPILTAKMLATLDRLSGGRVIAG